MDCFKADFEEADTDPWLVFARVLLREETKWGLLVRGNMEEWYVGFYSKETGLHASMAWDMMVFGREKNGIVRSLFEHVRSVGRYWRLC
jgi:hypothetical protein